MKFIATNLTNAWLVESERHEDERGYFARLRCSGEFRQQGLPATFVQTNFSHNKSPGTFRGLHFQMPPSREGKLVRCVAGLMSDVIVDLRPGSPSFLQHQWFELSPEKLQALFVPTGFAHGFLTRKADTSVLYEMTDAYAPELGRGLRWNDPALGIELPADVVAIHPRDAAYADLDVDQLNCFQGWAT